MGTTIDHSMAKCSAEPPPLLKLPIELTDMIYAFLLTAFRRFSVRPAIIDDPEFGLRREEKPEQHAAVQALGSLSAVSPEMRREVRKFFYHNNEFLVITDGCEYLQVFARWLDALGYECRKDLTSVSLVGFMWYHGSPQQTHHLHALLRSCTSARKTCLQLNIRHFCEAKLKELDAYLNSLGPEPHDGPLPDIDISPWVGMIRSLPEAASFELGLVLSEDEDASRATMGWALSDDRGNKLACDIKRKLVVAAQNISPTRNVAITLKCLGRDVRYHHPRSISSARGPIIYSRTIFPVVLLLYCRTSNLPMLQNERYEVA